MLFLQIGTLIFRNGYIESMRTLKVLGLIAITGATFANTCNLKTRIFDESGNLVISDGRIIRIGESKISARLPVKGVNISVDVSVDLANQDIKLNSESISDKKIGNRSYNKYGEQIIEAQLNGQFKNSLNPFSDELKVESTLSCIVEIS